MVGRERTGEPHGDDRDRRTPAPPESAPGSTGIPAGVAVGAGGLMSWLSGQPAERRARSILALQRGAGNAALSRALAPPAPQDVAEVEDPAAGERGVVDGYDRRNGQPPEPHAADVEAAVGAVGAVGPDGESGAHGAAVPGAATLPDSAMAGSAPAPAEPAPAATLPDGATAGTAPAGAAAIAPAGAVMPALEGNAKPLVVGSAGPGAPGGAPAPEGAARVPAAAPSSPARSADALGGAAVGPVIASSQAAPPGPPVPPRPLVATPPPAIPPKAGASAPAPVDLAAVVRARGGQPEQGESPIATAARAGLTVGLDELSTAAQASIAALHVRARTEADQVGQTAVAAATEVGAAAQAAGDAISDHAAAEREGLHGSAASHAAGVAQWHATASAGAHEQITAHGERAQALGSEHGTQAAAAGETAATRIQGDTAGAADRTLGSGARSGGDEVTGPPKAEVSSRVAGPAADSLHGEGAQATASVRDQMAQAASTFQTRGTEASTAIKGTLAPVADALSQTAQQSTATIHEAAAHGVTALSQGETQAHARIGAQVTAVHGQLAAGAADKQTELIQAGEHLAEQVRVQAEHLAGVATDQVEDLIAQLPPAATSHLDPAASADAEETGDDGDVADDAAGGGGSEDHAAEEIAAAAAVQRQISTAFNGAAQEHATATEQAGQTIADAAAGAHQAIRDVPEATSRDLQTAKAAVTREMSGAASKVHGALAQVPQKAKTSGDAVVIAASAKAADTVAQTGTAMGQGLADMRQRSDQHAGGVSDRSKEVAGQVDANVATGHQRIDEHAKKPEHRSLLDRAFDWVKEQLSDLWNMVKNPGFWVGLLITVVLGGLAVFFLGPFALLLLPFITALAAAAGQVTNNLVAGKGAWDGVWDAAVEGFVGGAIFAAAIGLGVWAGVGAAGMLAIVEITTVVVTVGSNLIHGERPTKNLLANMLFAWLLDRVGGRINRGRAPNESKPPPEIKPPETKPPETKPPDVKPPEVKPPETKPPTEVNPPRPEQPPLPKPDQPKVPEPERPPVEPVPVDPWARVQSKHPGLSDNHVAMLRETGIDPAMADRCLSRGMSPEDLVLRSIEGGPATVEIIDGLLSGKGPAKVDARAANRVAELARRLDEMSPGQGLFDAVHKLATSGALRNPASLRPLLEAISAGDANKIVELRVAAERAAPGGDVQLGPIGRQGADVVDHPAQEAMQIKNVGSPDERAVERNLTDATNQLAGKGASGQRTPGDPDTEVPPNKPDGTPYTRTAELFINNERNPLFDADRATVDAFVRETLKTANNRGSVDQVRIHNHNPGSPFTILGPF